MIYSLELAADRLSEFDKLLAKYDIKYDKDSAFYKSAFRVLEMLEQNKKKIELDDHQDMRPYIREALGLNDFLAKILTVKDHHDFNILVPHLKKIARGSPAQTIKSATKGVTNEELDESNKLFELYLACLVLPEFPNLALDDPNKSSDGENPDLLFDAYDKRYAIAAKALRIDSIKTKTIYDNWEKGSDQIERSKADRGIVFVSLRNLIEYDDLWPVTNREQVAKGAAYEYGAFADPNEPTNRLYQYGHRIGQQMIDELGRSAIQPIIDRKTSIGGFVVAAQSATGILVAGRPFPSIIRVFTGVQFPPFDDEVNDVLCRLNHQMQIIS